MTRVAGPWGFASGEFSRRTMRGAAAALLLERGIAGLAVDTLSVDVGSSSSFEVHYQVLGASKYNVENCIFDEAMPPICSCVVAPLSVKDAPECPARMVAW